METYGQEGIQIWQPEVRMSILCSTIRSVEDNDGNDIRTYTTDIWLLQVRVSDQSRGSSDGNKIIIIAVL